MMKEPSEMDIFGKQSIYLDREWDNILFRPKSRVPGCDSSLLEDILCGEIWRGLLGHQHSLPRQ